MTRLIRAALLAAATLVISVPIATEAQTRSVSNPATAPIPAPKGVQPVAATPGFTSALNGFRARAGLPALAVDPRLNAAAQAHATDMARRGYFSHTGADGSSHGDRIRRAGIRACLSAENIAMGQTSEQEVLQAWVDSPGHRRNLLSGATAYGLGRAGNIWVMVLARPC